ncbi:TonB family protein [Endozoicomonas arenosclerae]|uniref:TonB family protein n=1 Tax=Endozoicomonas arenosclerae TaxID=1633495 RepID=UPI000780F01F|nr:TonB family protein [Endozoicomonas arenosclerae]
MLKKFIPALLLLTGCTANPPSQHSVDCNRLEPFTLSDYTRTLASADIENLPMPKRLYMPDYPKLLLQKGVEGQATVQYEVLESGRVENIQVVSSSNQQFATSFKQAVTCWSFEPAHQVSTLQQTFFWQLEG